MEIKMEKKDVANKLYRIIVVNQIIKFILSISESIKKLNKI